MTGRSTLKSNEKYHGADRPARQIGGAPRLAAGVMLAWIVCSLLLLSASASPAAEPATAKNAMVATVHPLATDAAVDALRAGGNAVDAAVAAALTLGVVDNHNSGIGGGCFILIRRADGKIIAIDGRETAPAKATRDMYLRGGKPDPMLSRTGPLASGTPGALAAYAEAVQRHGRLELAELLLPAARIAERGFAVDRIYAGKLKSTASSLAQFEGSRKALLKADGSPYEEGEVLRQRDLARTYRSIAEHGADWFYRGPLAREVGRWMADNGGILSADDFAAYRIGRRDPIVSTYRGYTIVGFPPPSSGGIHVAQILNILERFDLKRLAAEDRSALAHVVAEAMKLAFADRAHWLGDADFADVPRGLIDKQYAAGLARRIDPQKATKVIGHSRPPRADADLFNKHTTHIAAADAEGNWVAITATVNTSFGSKVIVPGLGVVLNNQMDDFSIHPGVPNAFGLIGNEANAIQAGKRPLSSMSPTIVLREGRPLITLGAAGGPTIISQVVLGIINQIDLGMSLPEAIGAGRLHHQWAPDVLMLERGLSNEIGAGLQRRGHKIQTRDYIGVSQAVMFDQQRGLFVGVHDPRVPGRAAGR